MDSALFDRLTRRLVQRPVSRRSVLAGSAALALGSAGVQRVHGQEATPAVVEEGGPAFLFVQLAEAGSWSPKPDEDGVFLLTLLGAGSQTLYFSDRPERIVGTVPTDQFLEGLGFTPENPPNAALAVQTPEGERDVLVVELFNPVYTQQFAEDGSNSVTYDARILEAYEGEGLTTWVAEQEDTLLPEQFSNVSLFIDDCADVTVGCRNRIDEPGEILGVRGMCWSWEHFACEPCGSSWTLLSFECNNSGLPNCNGCCYAYHYGTRESGQRC